MSDRTERQQENAIANTYASRPGAEDVTPAGVSETQENTETAPFVQSGSAATGSVSDSIPSTEQVKNQIPGAQGLQQSVRSSVDSASQQIPSSQDIAEQVPSTKGVLNTLSQGVNYVAESVKGLAISANNSTAPKVTTDASQKQDSSELNVPGKFVDDTSSSQRPVDTLDELKANLPGRGSSQQSTEAGQKDNFQHTHEQLAGQPRNPVSGTLQSGAPPAERKEELLPAAGQSNTLSEQQQDDVLSDSRPARPGVSSGAARPDVSPDTSSNLPVGIASSGDETHSAGSVATSSGNPTLEKANQQVKATIESGASAVYNQLPSAQTVQQTAQSGAQYAAESTKSGANAVYQQAPSTQQVQETAQSGAQSVQGGAQTAASTVQSGLHRVEEQAYQAAQSVLGTVQSGLGYVKETVAGHQQAQDNDAVHRDGTDYIKEQLESERADTDKHNLPKGEQDSGLPVTTDTRSHADESSPLGSNATGERPAHAGTAPGIPRDTVESSAEPDVSYEHRPKTLPQSEIIAREQERGITEPGLGAPSRVEASQRAGQWTSEATTSAETVHEKSEVERELLRKVEPAPPSAEGVSTSDSTAKPSTGTGVTVVGNWESEAARASCSGPHVAQHEPGQDPAYPRVGTAQVGERPNQSDTIPPVIVPRAGPEPGKGVAPIQGDDLEAAQRDVFGSGAHLPNPTPREHTQPPPHDTHIRPTEQFTLNPVDTSAGQGLSALPIVPSNEPPQQQHSSTESNTLSGQAPNQQQQQQQQQEQQPSSHQPGNTFDRAAQAGSKAQIPAATAAKERLRQDTQGGVRENPASIPTAGGKRIGEDHLGESWRLE